MSARANKEVDTVTQVPGCCSAYAEQESVPVLKWIMKDHAVACEGVRLARVAVPTACTGKASSYEAWTLQTVVCREGNEG